MTSTLVHLAPINRTIIIPILRLGSAWMEVPVELANAWAGIGTNGKVRVWAATEADCVDAVERLAPLDE